MPTIMAKIWTNAGFYTASVPAGTSKGSNEAANLAIDKLDDVVPTIRKNLIGLDEKSWEDVDLFLQQMDGTDNFSKLGGNVILAISLAAARAAYENEIWRMNQRAINLFPYPLGNIIGGGAHGGSTSWQEFLIIPQRARDPMEAAKINVDAWNYVKEELKKKGQFLDRNIENALIASLDEEKTLELLAQVAEDRNLKLGVDFAASSFWDGKKYQYKSGKSLTPEQQINYLIDIAKKYNLYLLEDPMHEDDFEGFATLTRELKGKVIVGDDLLCTNPRRMETAIKMKSINAAIVKPNQVGSLNLTKDFVDTAKKNRIALIMSHRSTDTEDTWLAEFGVVWEAMLIKIGMLGYDLPKHNKLIELWHDLPNPRMANLV
jgi:enolase